MNFRLNVPYWLVLLVVLLPQHLFAQEAQTGHPLLSDKFTFGIGIFLSDSDYKISADGSLPGSDIDFDESLSIDNSETSGFAELHWRFGEKWSVTGQAWQLKPGSR